jgi:hypothetical protein
MGKEVLRLASRVEPSTSWNALLDILAGIELPRKVRVQLVAARRPRESMSDKGREYRTRDLKWHDRKLRLKAGCLLATVEPDRRWTGMFRIRLQNGQLTDMVNITRAKDAAIALALAHLNRIACGRLARTAARMRFNEKPVFEAAE